MAEPKPILRKKPLNPEGECAIQITYRKKGELVPLKISTGVYVKEENFKNGLIIEPDFTSRQAKQKEVNSFVIRLNKIIREFQEAGIMEPGAKEVKERFSELYEKKEGLKEIENAQASAEKSLRKLKPLLAFEKFIEVSESGERRKQRGGKLRKSSIAMYKAAKSTVEKFVEETDYDLSRWENLNEAFYYAFTDFCFDKLNLYDNTTGKYVKQLRTWLNWCCAKEITPKKLYTSNWVVWAEEETESLVLWPDELKVIARLPDSTFNLIKHGTRTRDLFLMGCLTCVRVSDLWKLEKDGGYIEKRNNSFYFSYDQTKTDGNAGVEIAPVGVKILNKYYDTEEGFPKISDPQFNRDLKEFGRFMKRYFIKKRKELEKEGLVLQDWAAPFNKRRRKRGEVVKIEKVPREKFTSHLMRRTGITSLAIAGLNNDEIKKVSGHVKDKELEKYKKIADRFRSKTISKAWASILD